jgi:hypothetical protein
VRVKQARALYYDELIKGDCLANPIPKGDVSMVKIGPCSQPHREEVYAIFNLAPGHYDGQRMVDQRGDAGCKKRFANYVGINYDSSALDYFAVTPDARDLPGARKVRCVMVDHEDTGTLEGARR